MTNNAQKKLVRRIKNLMDLAGNNTSEAEAVAAMAKARQLMDEYGISVTDVNEVDEEWGQAGVEWTSGKARRAYHRSYLLGGVIGQVCGTTMYRCGGEVFFFGRKHEVEISHYMLMMVRNLVEGAYLGWKKTDQYMVMRSRGAHAPRLKTSFVNGMVASLHLKLQDMIPQPGEGSGRDLVVCHQAVMERKLKEFGLDIKSSPVSLEKGDLQAGVAGYEAGENAQLSSGVGKSGKETGGLTSGVTGVKLIGG